MASYALKDTIGTILRYQDFTGTPPILTPEKGLIWVLENPPAPPVPPAPTPEQIVAQLWQAAHDYEYSQVSGSAIGLLAIGVMKSLPKCVAVQNWIKSIWTLYYTRKATLTVDYDFSIVGACPHTVPELMLELGL